MPVGLLNAAGALLDIKPAILSSGDEHVVGLWPAGPPIGSSTPESRASFASGLRDRLLVQRWREGRWAEEMTVALQRRQDPEFDTERLSVELPAMSAGPRRLCWAHASTGDLTCAVWILDGLPTPPTDRFDDPR